MANLKILPPVGTEYAEVVDYSTQTVASPASNVLQSQPQDAWETTAITSQHIELDLYPDSGEGTAALFSWNAIALMYTNLTTAATVSIVRGGSSPPATSWASGLTPADGEWSWNAGQYDDRHLFYIGSDASSLNRFIKFTISDATNPDGALRIGYVAIGYAIQPSINAQYGYQFGWDDQSARTRSSSGAIIPRTQRPSQVHRFTLQSEGDYASSSAHTWNSLYRNRGSSKPVIVNFDGDSSKENQLIVYGLMQQRFQFSIPSHNYWECQFDIQGMV